MIVARPGVADQRLCVPARQRPVSRLSIRRRNGVKLLRKSTPATSAPKGSWICATLSGGLVSGIDFS
jgi:hypothetical protein